LLGKKNVILRLLVLAIDLQYLLMEINNKIIIKSPLYIELGVRKVKRYYLNLNVYRNICFQVNNNLKIKYKALISSQIAHLKLSKFELRLTMHRKDKRRVDRANVLSIHEKFFADSLVELGCVEDDNDNYIIASHYYTGEVKKNDPHVAIEIIPLV